MSRSSLLVLGGARSGKSRLAQERAEALPGPPVYIATAEAWDDEMRERIAQHRADRGGQWATVEAPLALPEAIVTRSGTGHVLLVDCLTLWATNLLLGEHDTEAATEALCAAVADFDGHLILVANEVGLGIVPDNALARRFRDVAGRMNQRVAAVAEEVLFVAAGLPLRLK
ncbi:MAG TPA: bifunctional adenosylcobinamide kinase/adenosylcobinamide-phosphate guanylyltransferase [Sphingobium sp.]|uniref:bifunctional adenosylcobinamide kinase/adenosylcobinamide-phosphate guanylyltransferase n=1 Tax=Sphingobium sp. TaxID=1912891 RepID=UPI002ED57FD0